jgi:hypothetical protein
MSDKLIDRLRAASAARTVSILGVNVHVTPLTLAEQAKANAMFPDDSAKRQAQILLMKCLDAEGKRLFNDVDRDALAGEINAGAFSDVWAAINGRTVEAHAEK